MEFEKLVAIIAEKMDIDAAAITPQTSFESLKVDSLDMVEIIMSIEEAFNITLDVEPDALKTVDDLVSFIKTQR